MGSYCILVFLDKQEKTAKLNTNSEGVPNHCGQIGRVYMTCIAFPPTILNII